MGFLFPRTVRLSRLPVDAGVGARPYAGLRPATEATVLASARAHIQPERQGAKPLPGLPGDAEGQPTWKVIVKLPKGAVQKRDVLTDDLGNRYQAIYAAWNPLSTTVLAVALNGVGALPSLVPTWETLAAGWDALAANWADYAFPDSWDVAGAWDQTAAPWAEPIDAAGGGWDTTNTNWDAL